MHFLVYCIMDLIDVRILSSTLGNPVVAAKPMPSSIHRLFNCTFFSVVILRSSVVSCLFTKCEKMKGDNRGFLLACMCFLFRNTKDNVFKFNLSLVGIIIRTVKQFSLCSLREQSSVCFATVSEQCDDFRFAHSVSSGANSLRGEIVRNFSQSMSSFPFIPVSISLLPV